MKECNMHSNFSVINGEFEQLKEQKTEMLEVIYALAMCTMMIVKFVPKT